jgi:hypothetical protein
MTVSGRANVDRGSSLLARIIAWCIGFPKHGTDVPVKVQFTSEGNSERWTRTFANHSFSSVQYQGRGRSEWLLCERFGMLVFAMALVVEEHRLRLVLRRWSAFGIPLPLWLAPRSESYETQQNGRFHFRVEISHPLAGLIVRYRGWLVGDNESQPPSLEPMSKSEEPIVAEALKELSG